MHRSSNRHPKLDGLKQDVTSVGEALALLDILALGRQEIEAGKVTPLADVVARLRAKQAA